MTEPQKRGKRKEPGCPARELPTDFRLGTLGEGAPRVDVEDLGSSYGTQINGKKLPRGEKHLLRKLAAKVRPRYS